MADIPGLIEGASNGVGLGYEFLRHVDRCRLLIHVVDVSGSEGRDPIEDFKLINTELSTYNEDLTQRPQIIAANKADVAQPEDIERFRAFIEEKGCKFFPISAASRQGVDKLISAVAKKLATLPPVMTYEPEAPIEEPKKSGDHDISIEVRNGVYYIEGEWLKGVIGSVNFDDTDSLRYFERVLKTTGVIKKLEKSGVNEGDTVNIYGMEFDYVR
jgi:GTP-binding protein